MSRAPWIRRRSETVPGHEGSLGVVQGVSKVSVDLVSRFKSAFKGSSPDAAYEPSATTPLHEPSAIWMSVDR